MFMDPPPPPEDFNPKLEQVVVVPVLQQVKKIRFWDAIYGVGMVLTIEEIIDGIEQGVIVGLNQAEESFHTNPEYAAEPRRLITPLEYARSINRDDLAGAIEAYASSDKSSQELLEQLGKEAFVRSQSCQPLLRKSAPFNALDWFDNPNYFYGKTSEGKGFFASIFEWIDKKCRKL